MFECLLTPTQWVFYSLINLCSDNFMDKISNRYLSPRVYNNNTLATTIDLQQNKASFYIKFTHKSGINTILTNVWE